MSNRAPRRLLETEGLGEALRTDLRRAAAHDVGYDVDAGLARLESAMARGGPPPSDGGGAAAAASSGKGLAIVVGLALVVGVGAIAWSLASGPASTKSGTVAAAEPVVAAEVEAELAQTSLAAQPPAEPGTEPGSPSDDPGLLIIEEAETPVESGAELPAAESSASARGRAPAKPRSAKPSRAARPAEPADDDRLHREMLATDRARQALGDDPARALALVRKADDEFPAGLFSEDREGIEILALFELGRLERARSRAKAFLRAHPRSSYADRIRAAVTASKQP